MKQGILQSVLRTAGLRIDEWDLKLFFEKLVDESERKYLGTCLVVMTYCDEST